MLLHKFKSKRIIAGKLLTLNPIHIGSSINSLDPTQTESAVLTNIDGRPVIPGSSLKGVLRSILESYQAVGALGEDHKKECFITDKNNVCFDEQEYKELKDKYIGTTNSKSDYENFALEVYKKSCMTCKLFGNGYMTARVHIIDATLEKSQKDIKLEIRDGVAINRDTGTAVDGAKYNYTAVPADMKFDFYLVAKNLEEDEQKILDIILKLLTDGEIAVGGFTSRGLGRIKLVEGYKDEMIDINRLIEDLQPVKKGDENNV